MNSFINKKLLEIDAYIEARKFTTALERIEDVLEWVPGFAIGNIPKSGEIYWKKLFAEIGCRNESELLSRKKKPLQAYSAFLNAKKYANDNERSKYELIEKTEDLTMRLLVNELNNSEIKAKRETGVENSLIEYKQRLNEFKNLVQKNMVRLEEVEKSIHEQCIICKAVIDEYRFTINDLHSEAQEYLIALNNMLSKTENEISLEAKTNEMAQLDCIQSDSNDELDNLEQIVAKDPRYINYLRLVDEQKSICDDIKQNLIDLGKIQFDVKQLVESVESIAKVYSEAKTDVYESNYDGFASLLSKARVDEIILQAIHTMKNSD